MQNRKPSDQSMRLALNHGVGLTRAIRILGCLLIIAGAGCARHHTYIDPNGNVTTVGHQPFWGPSRVPNQTVVASDVATQVQGGKLVAQAPNQGQAIVGVVNPAIPEAVIVQNPGNGSTSEPSLSDTGPAGANAPPTQITGGIPQNSTIKR